MRTRPHRVLQAAGFLACALAVSQCGDSSVTFVGDDDGLDPIAGTFTGTTVNGGILTVVVGSIDSATLLCDGESVGGACAPPLAVVSGHAAGACSGLTLEVTFTARDRMTLDVQGGTPCDGRGTATLTGPTPTPSVTSMSPTPTPSSTGSPSPSGVTPTPTPTTATTPCPSQVTFEGQGAQAMLNTGTTGIAFNQTVIEHGTITGAITSCNPGVPGNCGDCVGEGPIESASPVNNRRCTGNTSVECTGDADCTGIGPCAFFFGSYLPLSSGGVPVCVRNRITGLITGQGNLEAGTLDSDVPLLSQVFTGVDTARPCPTCSGAAFLASGTCSNGPRDGMPCTVHGTSAKFGNTSFDCPPNESSNIGNLVIDFGVTTGTAELFPTETCTDFPFTGLACYCDGQRRPNSCASGLCEGVDAGGVGVCAGGPFVGFCRPTDSFRTCLTDDDCPAAGDACQFEPQPCHGPQNPDTFAINAPLRLTGVPDTHNPTFVAIFCVDAVAASAVNEAAGLPGPGTLKLPAKACYEESCFF